MKEQACFIENVQMKKMGLFVRIQGNQNILKEIQRKEKWLI